MKSATPFLGVRVPVMRTLTRAEAKLRPFATPADLIDTVLRRWREAGYREERYAAITLPGTPAARRLRDPALLQTPRELIVTGAWWDYVDELVHRVGDLLAGWPAEVRPALLTWTRSDDRWLRRASIICQLGARDRADVALLTIATASVAYVPATGWALTMSGSRYTTSSLGGRTAPAIAVGATAEEMVSSLVLRPAQAPAVSGAGALAGNADPGSALPSSANVSGSCRGDSHRGPAPGLPARDGHVTPSSAAPECACRALAQHRSLDTITRPSCGMHAHNSQICVVSNPPDRRCTTVQNGGSARGPAKTQVALRNGLPRQLPSPAGTGHAPRADPCFCATARATARGHEAYREGGFGLARHLQPGACSRDRACLASRVKF